MFFPIVFDPTLHAALNSYHQLHWLFQEEKDFKRTIDQTHNSPGYHRDISDRKMSPRDSYVVIKALSNAKHGGNNCGVYLVQSKVSGKYYIEKRLPGHLLQGDYAIREVRVMRQCVHPNIVAFRQYDFEHTTYGSIFMQNCELGSLDILIQKFRKRNALLEDEGFLWKVFYDLSLALCYLNTGVSTTEVRRLTEQGKAPLKVSGWNWVVHRDIKPGNIFLTDSAEAETWRYPTAVLGDFGGCVTRSDVAGGRVNPRELWGTPSFQTPESPSWSDATDVYLLAATIHCLATMNQSPMHGHQQLELDPMPYGSTHRALPDLLRKCLRVDRSRRPGPHELPCLVWQGYTTWRTSRGGEGARLKKWALM